MCRLLRIVGRYVRETHGVRSWRAALGENAAHKMCAAPAPTCSSKTRSLRGPSVRLIRNTASAQKKHLYKEVIAKSLHEHEKTVNAMPQSFPRPSRNCPEDRLPALPSK